MTASLSPRSTAVRAFAWGGGLAFVASLAWFVYFYSTVLGHRPAPREALARHLIIDLLLFTIFAGHHSFFARDRVKQVLTRWIPPALERSTYVWIASALFLWVCIAWQPVPGGELYAWHGWLAWPSVGTQLIGVTLTLRAAGVLDGLELAGIRQARGEVRPQQLRIVGPYRWVRHPLYLGWMLFVLGAPTMTVDRLAFAAISSLYLLLAIPWEERSLRASLGAPYLAYMRQVRWRVVPFVY